MFSQPIQRITITLNEDQFRVLCRCLSYGEHAISEAEFKSDKGEIILRCINEIRAQLINSISF